MKTHNRRTRRHLVCPECGETARRCPPRRWVTANGPRPRWSHTDGEPLCPIPGATGSRPADPHPVPPARRVRRLVAVPAGAPTAPVAGTPDGGPVYVVGTGDSLTVFGDRETADRTVATMTGVDFTAQVLPLVADHWDELRAIMAVHQPQIRITDTRAGRGKGAQ